MNTVITVTKEYKDFLELSNKAVRKLNEISPAILEIKDIISQAKDPAQKATLERDMLHKLESSVLTKDIRSLDLVLATLEAVGKDSEVRLSSLNYGVVNAFDRSLDAMLSDRSLNKMNVISILDCISRNKIPVLVGEAGCGKTYTVSSELMISMVAKFKNFNTIKVGRINCSGISHNSLWGSLDAVSHVCIGYLKSAWRDAEKDSETLYYIILDEMLDIENIRYTFGEGFAKLTELPKNLVLVGTGNNSSWDLGVSTQNEIECDAGISGRFELIDISNILYDLDSEEANIFISSLGVDEKSNYRISLAKTLLKSTKNKMLVPRKLKDFVNSNFSFSDDRELVDYLLKRYEMDTTFFDKLLFAEKPKVKESEKVDDLREVLYAVI